jgi:hypothetical protein
VSSVAPARYEAGALRTIGSHTVVRIRQDIGGMIVALYLPILDLIIAAGG